MPGKTYGQQFEEVLRLTTANEGAEWLRAEVKRIGKLRECRSMRPDQIRRNIRESIGYMTGYSGAKEAAHVRVVLGATHPFFGDLSERPPIAEQALAIGKAIGQAMKQPAAGPSSAVPLEAGRTGNDPDYEGGAVTTSSRRPAARAVKHRGAPLVLVLLHEPRRDLLDCGHWLSHGGDSRRQRRCLQCASEQPAAQAPSSAIPDKEKGQ